jgi:hypothetical protein
LGWKNFAAPNLNQKEKIGKIKPKASLEQVSFRMDAGNAI